MSLLMDSYEKCAKDIIDRVGKCVVIGVPLGLGKPIGLLNALFRLAQNDASIQLTIFTGLTLARPPITNELEKRLVEPILDRLLKNNEDPLYERYRVLQQLPANINVIEFFLMPGKFLHNHYVQQHYVSSCYTTVVRDLSSMSVNVLAQMVAPSATHPGRYSLSCNSDLFHGVRQQLLKSAAKGGQIAIVAEVNSALPYMYGVEAEVDEDIFSTVVDTQQSRSLFVLPRDRLSPQDHLIGLYMSSLIKDDGCLQVGIGKLSNALASALIFRHKENDAYRELMQQLQIEERYGKLISDSGSLDGFTRGLYASTEMLSDEYMHLYHAGILKKRVYDHIGLQALLNQHLIEEKVTSHLLDVLLEHQLIQCKLTLSDVLFLKKFGIFKNHVTFQDGQLLLDNGEVIPADLSLEKSKCRIIDHCLGARLLSGKIMHAGFFLGSGELYAFLKQLPDEEKHTIEMTSIARTNSLLSAPDLLKLQRQHGRFVNSSLMVTLLGGAISDGLADYQEVSGVGGQYDFVSMATQLTDARSIINCHSTRVAKNNKVVSNVVWDYSNSTIPRYFRDIVVTEYGIADCRSKTDADVIKAMLNIADSRFQPDLLAAAIKSGKLPFDYHIPEIYRNNYPYTIEKILKPLQQHGYCMPYPFGSDLTNDEEVISQALLYLKGMNTLTLFAVMLASLVTIRKYTQFDRLLDRMHLKKVNNVKEYIYKRLISWVLYHSK